MQTVALHLHACIGVLRQAFLLELTEHCSLHSAIVLAIVVSVQTAQLKNLVVVAYIKVPF